MSDLLRPLPTTPIYVPYPVDDRLCAVADTLLADPADPRRLDARARAVGVSRRTLTRLCTSPSRCLNGDAVFGASGQSPDSDG